MDVKGLYPRVPRKEARIAVEKALEEREDRETSTEAIMELMDLVLQNNYIRFSDNFYL